MLILVHFVNLKKHVGRTLLFSEFTQFDSTFFFDIEHNLAKVS